MTTDAQAEAEKRYRVEDYRIGENDYGPNAENAATIDRLSFVAGAEWEAERSRERIAQLEAALRPFARLYDQAMEDRPDDWSAWAFNERAIAYGDLRRARALLPSPPADTEGEAK